MLKKNFFINKSILSIFTLTIFTTSPSILSAMDSHDNPFGGKALAQPFTVEFPQSIPAFGTAASEAQPAVAQRQSSSWAAPFVFEFPQSIPVFGMAASEAQPAVAQSQGSTWAAPFVFGFPQEIPVFGATEQVPQKPIIRIQPNFDPLNSTELSTLYQLANKGDRKAQDLIIERNYWGFLDTQFQCSLWGDGLRNASRLINPRHWMDIEKYAIENDQYAYALIHAYAHDLNWNRVQVKLPFHQKYPRLFKSLQEGVEADDPNAQFSLGIMYLQLNPQDSALPAGVDKLPFAIDLIKKAANQGHSLAMSALGQIYWTRGPQGRNDADALRWFLPSKQNKLSQEATQKILLNWDSQALPVKTTFYEEIEDIKFNLIQVSQRSHNECGLHDTNGKFAEHEFAIPELGESYKKVVEVHEEAIDMLNSLQSTTPGFLTKRFALRDQRDGARMISSQREPAFVSFHEIEKEKYFVFGRENVRIANKFVEYLNAIDDKFLLVDSILKQDSESYRSRLNSHFDILKEVRLSCLKYQRASKETPCQQNQVKLDKWTERFKKQTAKYEKKKQVLTPIIDRIKEERKTLSLIRKSIKGIIKNSAARDQEFLLEHPYLK